MKARTCFVMTAIGEQEYGGQRVTAGELRKRYDDLIKEALLKVDPRMEITRADDVPMGGTITTDIVMRIMHSDLVVADVTFPNPNVFYELGLRHASRSGTLIIKDKNGPRVPFDISHLRHIEYENTPSGLKDLESNFKKFLEQLLRDPSRPDNHFLEIAKLTHYAYPDFQDPADSSPEMVLVQTMLSSPELLSLAMRGAKGEDIPPETIIQAIVARPENATLLARALVSSGKFSLGGGSAVGQPNARKVPTTRGRSKKPKGR